MSQAGSTVWRGLEFEPVAAVEDARNTEAAEPLERTADFNLRDGGLERDGVAAWWLQTVVELLANGNLATG